MACLSCVRVILNISSAFLVVELTDILPQVTAQYFVCQRIGAHRHHVCIHIKITGNFAIFREFTTRIVRTIWM